MLNVKTGVFVDVLSQADLVTCGIDPSGRKLGPSSLYSYRHPAKKIVPKIGLFRTDLGTRPLA